MKIVSCLLVGPLLFAANAFADSQEVIDSAKKNTGIIMDVVEDYSEAASTQRKAWLGTVEHQEYADKISDMGQIRMTFELGAGLAGIGYNCGKEMVPTVVQFGLDSIDMAKKLAPVIKKGVEKADKTMENEGLSGLVSDAADNASVDTAKKVSSSLKSDYSETGEEFWKAVADHGPDCEIAVNKQVDYWAFIGQSIKDDASGLNFDDAKYLVGMAKDYIADKL